MKLPLAYAKQDQKDTYLIGLAWGKILMEEEIKYKHDIFVNANHQLVLINSSPYGLHSLMFIPTLRLQCNFEQQKYWLPLAESGQIIGAYCQTEYEALLTVSIALSLLTLIDWVMERFCVALKPLLRLISRRMSSLSILQPSLLPSSGLEALDIL